MVPLASLVRKCGPPPTSRGNAVNIDTEFERLRGLVRRLINDYKLPVTVDPDSVQGGHQIHGGKCNLCGDRILAGCYLVHHEYPDTPGKLVPAGRTQYEFHFLCHAAWQVETANAVAAQSKK